MSNTHRELIRTGVTPLSVLVPMEPGGELIIWEGSQRIVWASDISASTEDPMEGLVMDVPMYSMVVFR